MRELEKYDTINHGACGMIIIMAYRLEEQDGIFFVRTREAGVCPICGESLTIRGERIRTVINSNGDKIKLVIRRLKCEKCKQIHHELPDCIVPYKRHCAETIESIVNKKAEKAACEAETIRKIKKWWEKAVSYYINILKSLSEKYQLKFNEPPYFKEIVRAVVNSSHWIREKIN